MVALHNGHTSGIINLFTVILSVHCTPLFGPHCDVWQWSIVFPPGFFWWHVYIPAFSFSVTGSWCEIHLHPDWRAHLPHCGNSSKMIIKYLFILICLSLLLSFGVRCAVQCFVHLSWQRCEDHCILHMFTGHSCVGNYWCSLPIVAHAWGGSFNCWARYVRVHPCWIDQICVRVKRVIAVHVKMACQHITICW